jgi:hypothetical protein
VKKPGMLLENESSVRRHAKWQTTFVTQTNDPQSQGAIHAVQAAYDIALKRG